MKDKNTELTMLHGLLAVEITAIIGYVQSSGNCDNGKHAGLHKAILEMHGDFPKWVQQRVACLEHASADNTIIKDGSES